jgi:ligand-binding SRPBCC domain-containing protein
MYIILRLLLPKNWISMCLTTQAGNLLKVQNFEGKILFQRREWHSVITSIRVYEYVDVMLSGPFKRWKHVHKFFYDIEQNQTEVVDEVEFELPYGLVGKMLEGFASNQLRKIFDHRRRITIEELVKGV